MPRPTGRSRPRLLAASVIVALAASCGPLSACGGKKETSSRQICKEMLDQLRPLQGSYDLPALRGVLTKTWQKAANSPDSAKLATAINQTLSDLDRITASGSFSDTDRQVLVNHISTVTMACR